MTSRASLRCYKIFTAVLNQCSQYSFSREFFNMYIWLYVYMASRVCMSDPSCLISYCSSRIPENYTVRHKFSQRGKPFTTLYRVYQKLSLELRGSINLRIMKRKVLRDFCLSWSVEELSIESCWPIMGVAGAHEVGIASPAAHGIGCGAD